LFSGRTVAMVHIGDSRAYLMRDGKLRQVTKDHTYVQMLLDEGAISAEEATHHPHRSLVTQVLQGQPIEPAYSVRPAVVGDRYLLCSDGLSNVVTLDTIAETLHEFPDPNECTEKLVQLALQAGGPDNITAVVADVVEGEAREGEAVVYRATSVDPAAAAAAVRQVVRGAKPRPTPRTIVRRGRRNAAQNATSGPPTTNAPAPAKAAASSPATTNGPAVTGTRPAVAAPRAVPSGAAGAADLSGAAGTNGRAAKATADGAASTPSRRRDRNATKSRPATTEDVTTTGSNGDTTGHAATQKPRRVPAMMRRRPAQTPAGAPPPARRRAAIWTVARLRWLIAIVLLVLVAMVGMAIWWAVS
jgi:hypothetical protein